MAIRAPDGAKNAIISYQRLKSSAIVVGLYGYILWMECSHIIRQTESSTNIVAKGATILVLV